MKTLYNAMSVPEELADVCEIGKYCYTDGGSPNVVINKEVCSKLKMGSFISIGPHCNIYLGSEHRTDFVSTFLFSKIFSDVEYIEGRKTKGNVEIGSDVWIGSYVTILSGVTIGHGAVIGTGSIVTKDVEPYAIVAGNPIREIRKRFTDHQIGRLLKIAWWEWPDEKIHGIIPSLMSADIEEFLGSM